MRRSRGVAGWVGKSEPERVKVRCIRSVKGTVEQKYIRRVLKGIN
ncbi:MAG: hypothetical protein WCS98_05700 [Bacillota bacterium]|nr:hypothetical protein [Bacillota bacterium]MDD3298772.1 hypothetical protein [Bacillota bacterium]MDD3850391.1 hypothetical protein [Bacillota bacterium]MDD4708018.1 hypothetical protein [Bacillota bacterium]